MILIDTSVWVDYFLGNGKVGEIINKEDVITPSVVLLELSVKARKHGMNFEECLEFVKMNSLVVGLNDKIISDVGKLYLDRRKIRPKLGIIDAVILSTALFEKAKVLTKDNDFRGLKNVVFLE